MCAVASLLLQAEGFGARVMGTSYVSDILQFKL